MSISDVLRKPGGEPIEQGLMLYRIFAEHHQLVLVKDHDARDDELVNFLQTERLDRHAYIASVPDVWDHSRVAQLVYVRNSGKPIELVIDADPSVCAELFTRGFPVLHFMQPAFARPSWRPDFVNSSPTPWDELVSRRVEEDHYAAERAKQRAAREGSRR